jgi:hypothetical protein
VVESLDSGEPPSVVCRPIALVAEDEDNLVLNVEMLSYIDGQPKKQKLIAFIVPKKILQKSNRWSAWQSIRAHLTRREEVLCQR